MNSRPSLFCLLAFIVGCFVCCFSCSARPTDRTAPTPASDASIPVTVGRWTARFLQGGLYLNYDGLPMLRGGAVQLFAPNYTRGYYGSGSEPPPATVEALPDGGRAYVALFHYTQDGRRFDATQRIEVHPNNTVQFSIKSHWQANDPALLEWNPLRFWAYPLIGSQCRITKAGDGKIQTGFVGLFARRTGFPTIQTSAGWTQATFGSTQFGTLTLAAATAGGDAPILFDAREDEYLKDEKVFWAGFNGTTLAPNTESERSLTLTVTPASPAQIAPDARAVTVETPTTIAAVPNAQSPLPPLDDAEGHPIIIPQPKIILYQKMNDPGFRHVQETDFVFDRTLPVYLTLPKTSEGKKVEEEVNRLLSELRERAGIKTQIHHQNGNMWGSGLRIGIIYPPGLPKSDAELRSSQGYSLHCSSAGISVIGQSGAGMFYGLQTLRQLLRKQPDGKWVFKGTHIVDEPALNFRGVHIFVGKDALPFHKKLIERLFARFKMNAVVIECEYTKWKSHPEIHVPYGMSPDDLRADVQFARDHFLETIPLVNTLGHSQWIFANNQHRDIVEDPRAPYAYDASNPKTYDFVFDIFKETLDIFQRPRRFHIGHDEVKIPGSAQFGQYPARPENIRKGVSRLFVDDTNHLAGWLRQHGAQTMLWADMLLHPSEGANLPGIPQLTAANAVTLAEAKERRAALPKDSILCDWRYAGGSEQRNGLDALLKAGFQAIGCAWYDPDNIRGWAQQAIAHHSLGTLQTTWAGYDSNESLLYGPEYKQFVAYLLAAEYAWTGSNRHVRDAAHPDAPNTLPYVASDVFARLWRDDLPYGKPRPGWLLTPSAPNFTLRADTISGLPWAALLPGTSSGPVVPLTDSTTGIAVSNGLTGLLLHSQLPPVTAEGNRISLPAAVSLPVKRNARSLAFVHALLYGVEAGTRVATYVVTYADGKESEIPIRSGLEIRALDDNSPSDTLSTTPLHLPDKSSPILTRRLFQWTNPRPDIAIARITFRAASPIAAPVLFSITGIQ